MKISKQSIAEFLGNYHYFSSNQEIKKVLSWLAEIMELKPLEEHEINPDFHYLIFSGNCKIQRVCKLDPVCLIENCKVVAIAKTKTVLVRLEKSAVSKLAGMFNGVERKVEEIAV